jgi:hypothetical protein
VEQRRVQGPAEPETYQFTTLAELFARDMALPKSKEYVSPDGSLTLPAYRVFQQGPPDYRGLRFSDSLDTYGFTTAKPGQRVFVANSSENKTYSGLVGKQGAITDLKSFADRGGESVAVDGEGRVYVANGQVFVYAPDGKEAGTGRYSRTAAATGLRRSGQADAVRADAPRAVRGEDA